MKYLSITYVFWCLYNMTADTTGSCDGNSTPSNAYFTAEGSVPPRTPCCFPFEFKGVSYSECTIQNHKRPWCSVDSVYNHRWGNCVPYPETEGSACIGNSSQSELYVATEGNAQGMPCCFPFWFNGMWYSRCSAHPKKEGYLFCSVDNLIAKENERLQTCERRPGSTTRVPPRPNTTFVIRTTTVARLTPTTTAKHTFDIPLAAIVAPVAVCFAAIIVVILVIICRKIYLDRRSRRTPSEELADGCYEYVGLGNPNFQKAEDFSLPRNRYSTCGAVISEEKNTDIDAKQDEDEIVSENSGGISGGYIQPV